MNFLISLLLFGSTLETENLVKALRYQYEKELKNLRVENAKLQQQVFDLKQEKELCSAATKTRAAPEQTAEASSKPQKILGDLDLYRAALENVDQENWNEAILQLEDLANRFPLSEYADNAVFLMAQVYQFKGEQELARLELLRLLKTYPRSERAFDAKSELQKIERFQSGEITR